MSWNKYSIAGSAIACVVTWYVLGLNGYLPTCVAVAVGHFVGTVLGKMETK